jgi:hypothetical protein
MAPPSAVFAPVFTPHQSTDSHRIPRPKSPRPPGRESQGRALIFFRHVQYLRVLYAYGHPDSSAVKILKLQTDDAWRSLFRNQHIRWVAAHRIIPNRNALCQRMESENNLVPCATGTVEDWAGNRIGVLVNFNPSQFSLSGTKLPKIAEAGRV